MGKALAGTTGGLLLEVTDTGAISSVRLQAEFITTSKIKASQIGSIEDQRRGGLQLRTRGNKQISTHQTPPDAVKASPREAANSPETEGEQQQKRRWGSKATNVPATAERRRGGAAAGIKSRRGGATRPSGRRMQWTYEIGRWLRIGASRARGQNWRGSGTH